jgi:hypothetical protein
VKWEKAVRRAGETIGHGTKTVWVLGVSAFCFFLLTIYSPKANRVTGTSVELFLAACKGWSPLMNSLVLAA